MRTGPFCLALAVLACAAAAGAEPVRIDGVRYTPRELQAGRAEASLVATDVNGDSHPDLLVAGVGSRDITVFLGDGRGGLRRIATVPAGPDPTDFTAADLDGDGRVDLAVANHETTQLTLLRGDGRGGFRPAPGSPLSIGVQPHPHVVRAADLDGDGRPELIVDHRSGGGLLVLRGLGGGRFSTPGTLVHVGGDPYLGFSIGDVNGDRRPDFVTPNPGEVGLTLNAGGLAFRRAPSVAAVAPFAVALADFDGDGDLDLLAAAEEAASPAKIYLGDGRGSFRAAPGAGFRLGGGAKNIATGDVNGDGVADALLCSWGGEALLLLGGQGEPRALRLRPAGIANPWGLVIADFNGDGRGDLAFADGITDRILLLLSGPD